MLFIALISSLLLHLMTVTMTLTPLYDYNATDNLLLNCGRVLEGTKLAAPIEDIDGRQWYTDAHYPNFLPYNFSGISTTTTASEQDLSVNRVPYMTGTRIMLSQFTYTFRVSPGAKFLRLYFYPADYSGYDKSESFFSVTANHFTLLSNFSAFYTVSASTNSSKAVRKEFVINVNETQILYITFSPSPNSYAFVNGIEIVSMPTNLYLGGDNHIKLVGQTDPYSINNNTALETLYRLNVGGHSVASTEDTGMYRVWDSDEEFVVVYGFQTPKFDVNITYTTETPPYVAPRIVYLTSRTMANNSQSLDWIFPLDSGFYYLFRLHFCQNQPEVKEVCRIGQRIIQIPKKITQNLSFQANRLLLQWNITDYYENERQHSWPTRKRYTPPINNFSSAISISLCIFLGTYMVPFFSAIILIVISLTFFDEVNSCLTEFYSIYLVHL